MPLEPKAGISIIIPVYNEAENVAALYQEIVAALPREDFIYEVIFIDDGSVDDTPQCLALLAREYANLSIVYHRKNFGQSAALLSGAKIARYAMLVTLDGDGQNDPKDIPKLLANLHNANTVVFGMRAKRQDNILRRVSSLLANGIRKYILKDGCADTGCSLKLFPRDAFLSLPHFNHLHRFLPALFRRAGFNLVNLPVNHRPRWHGISKYGAMNRAFVGIHDLIGVHWLLKRPCAPEVKLDEH